MGVILTILGFMLFSALIVGGAILLIVVRKSTGSSNISYGVLVLLAVGLIMFDPMNTLPSLAMKQGTESINNTRQQTVSQNTRQENTQTINSASNVPPQPAQQDVQRNTAPSNPSNNAANVDPMQYVTKKNQYNQEISALAADVNAYLNGQTNFRQDKKLLSRAENISRHVYGDREALRVAKIKDVALKNKLMEVFDALQGRVDGLLDGIRESKNGGDYTPGFKRGGNAYDRFEEANEALNKMLR